MITLNFAIRLFFFDTIFGTRYTSVPIPDDPGLSDRPGERPHRYRSCPIENCPNDAQWYCTGCHRHFCKDHTLLHQVGQTRYEVVCFACRDYYLSHYTGVLPKHFRPNR